MDLLKNWRFILKQVVILRGPSGSGKSTYAAKYHPCALILSADNFFMHNGEYQWSIDKIAQAHSWCMNQFLLALKGGEPEIVVDNTFTEQWEWENYAAVASIAEYSVVLVEFHVLTVEQIKMCASRNTHGVPMSTISNMALKFQPYLGQGMPVKILGLN